MRRIALILLLVSVSLSGRAAQRYHLVRVVVTGSTLYSQDDLVRATGLSANSQVTLDDLQQAGSRLGNCGAFSSVKFQYKAMNGPRDSVEADFEVKDAEKFLPASFENLVWYSDADLQQALHEAVPLFNGSLPLAGTLPDDLKTAIGRLQAARSLPAEVSYILGGEMGQPPSHYRYKIEDANLKIRDFRFVGANHMPADALLQAMAGGRGADYLRSSAMKMVSASLLPLYGERGYIQAAITEIHPSLEDGAVVLSVSVTEGALYRLGGYTWSGNTLVSSPDLSRYITLKTGEPVNASKLRYDLAQARKQFLKFGHEATVITPVPTFNQDTVNYEFAVKEGDVYRMGELEIDGFDLETARKLREKWKLARGAPYDASYKTQFFLTTLPLAHGRQMDWKILEQTDDSQKVVNVRLQFKEE